MVNADKSCIPVHSNSTWVPSIKEQFTHINKLTEMEELIHIAKERPDKYKSTWAC